MKASVVSSPAPDIPLQGLAKNKISKHPTMENGKDQVTVPLGGQKSTTAVLPGLVEPPPRPPCTHVPSLVQCLEGLLDAEENRHRLVLELRKAHEKEEKFRRILAKNFEKKMEPRELQIIGAALLKHHEKTGVEALELEKANSTCPETRKIYENERSKVIAKMFDSEGGISSYLGKETQTGPTTRRRSMLGFRKKEKPVAVSPLPDPILQYLLQLQEKLQEKICINEDEDEGKGKTKGKDNKGKGK